MLLNYRQPVENVKRLLNIQFRYLIVKLFSKLTLPNNIESFKMNEVEHYPSCLKSSLPNL